MDCLWRFLRLSDAFPIDFADVSGEFCDRIIAFMVDAFKNEFVDTEKNFASFPFPREFAFRFSRFCLSFPSCFGTRFAIVAKKFSRLFIFQALSVFYDIESTNKSEEKLEKLLKNNFQSIELWWKIFHRMIKLFSQTQIA